MSENEQKSPNPPMPEGDGMKPAYGVQEWAEHSVNIDLGCPNDCRYCYAKSMAVRFKRATAESWANPTTDLSKVAKQFRKRTGRIMFPTSHDIHRGNLPMVVQTLRSMLNAGNEVLVVTKPDPACIEVICDEFEDRKSQILFRFTIGSADDTTLKFWEPGAPSFGKRLEALRLAHERGFQTSVSCEPMLDKDIHKVVEAVVPFVTDAVWLGRVNNLRATTTLNCPGNAVVESAVERLLAEQTDEWLCELYNRYSNTPKIKFKDSIKKAVGLERPTEAGLDV